MLALSSSVFTHQFNLDRTLRSSTQTRMVAGCIRLDGRCLFQVAVPQPELPARIQDIQQRLETISTQ